MALQQSTLFLTNRRAISENFEFYSNYEKTNSALRIFGMRGSVFPSFNNLIKSKQRSFKSSKDSNKNSIKQLEVVQFSIRPKPYASVIVNRRLIRRIRRFETFSEVKKNENRVKTSVFGSYWKGSIFKRFNATKSRNEKSVPVLVSGDPETTRSVQNWEHSFSTNTFKSSNAIALSTLIGSSVHFRLIPAFSFARYARDLESVQRIARRKNEIGSSINFDSRSTSAIFLRHIAEEIRGRFQYVAIQIPDLLRISFVSIYFKNPSVLAQLFALTLGALPRNRKETQFLRFLLKVVKVFAAQRPEILGVRRRFKGRVNRWRRTKHVIGEKGFIPLYTYSARVEIGEAQAITRKGTLGIRIWLSYKNTFAESYRRTFIAYTHSTNRKHI